MKINNIINQISDATNYREKFSLQSARQDGTLGPFVGKYLMYECVHTVFEKYKHTIPSIRCIVATHVLADGLGDYYHAVNAINTLKVNFPHWDYTFIVQFANSNIKKETLTLPDTGDGNILFINEENKNSAITKIEESDLIINIPLSLNILTDNADKTKVLKVSEYGNPGFTAMGVGPSSWGVVVGNISKGSIHDIQDSEVLTLLTGFGSPSNEQIDKYRESTDRFFGYIKTSFKSSIAYFYSSVTYARGSSKDVDIFLPFDSDDAEQQFSLAMDIDFLKSHGIGSLEIVEKNGNIINQINVGEGKKARWLNVFPIKQNEVHYLMQDSAPLTGCSGDMSIGEAISAGKDFFYEGRSHKSKFVSQLINLAEKNTDANSALVQYLKIQKNLYALIESYLPENSSFEIIREEAEKLAQIACTDPFKEQMKDFRQLILDNFNFNSKLSSLAFRHYYGIHHVDFLKLQEDIAQPLGKKKIEEFSVSQHLKDSCNRIDAYVKQFL